MIKNNNNPEKNSGEKQTKEDKIYHFCKDVMEDIESAVNKRNTPSPLWNDVSYGENYQDNQKRAINAVKPKKKNKGQPDISTGIISEKVFNMTSIATLQIANPDIKNISTSGEVIKGLGKFFELGVQHTLEEEKFEREVQPYILQELYTQGDAFTFEDWYAKTVNTVKVLDENGNIVKDIDHSLETYENLKFEKGDQMQVRKARTRVLDGRTIIFGDITKENIQDQPWIALEFVYSKETANALFGTLTNFKKLKEERKQGVASRKGNLGNLKEEFTNLFGTTRKNDDEENFIIHYYFNKDRNIYNIFVDGVAMLDINLPLSLPYPRMNYPIVRWASERIRGSIYSRSIPAKTKFSEDYMNKVFRVIAHKFEKSDKPPILAKSRYRIPQDMFNAGKVNLNITSEDYDLADPNFQGITNSDMSFMQLMKDIIESQSLNSTTSGELSSGNTASEVAIVDKRQQEKLVAYMSSLATGYAELYERRIETIETKFTKQKTTTIIDDKVVPLFNDFTVVADGYEHFVHFNEALKDVSIDNLSKIENELSMYEKKIENEEGRRTKKHLIDPALLRSGNYTSIVNMKLKPQKNSVLDSIQLQDQITWIKNTWQNANDQELQKQYVKTSDQSEKIFIPQDLIREKQGGEEGAMHNTGSMGKGMTPKNDQRIKQ